MVGHGERVKRTNRGHRCRWLATLVAALVAVGCANGPAPDSAPSPAGPPRIDEPAGLPAITLADEPRWGSSELDVEQVDAVTFVGADTALVRAFTDDSDYPQLFVVDARTGEERWTTRMLAPLDAGADVHFMGMEWSVAGEEGEEVVLGRYYAESCITDPCPEDPSPEEGVVALSVEDGTVAWLHPTLPSLSEDDPDLDRQRDLTTVVVADGNDGRGAPAAVVGPTMALNGNENAAPDEFRTIALDPATGEETWSAEGVVGQRGAGGLLLATVPPEGPSGNGEPAQGGPLALAMADGTERWNVAAEHTATNLLGTTENTLLTANVLGGAIGGHQVLDLTDGSVLHDLGRGMLHPQLDTAGADLVVGQDPDAPDTLLSVTPDEPEPLRAGRPNDSIAQVSLVANGYVMITEATGRTTTVVDRSGTVLGPDLPGTPLRVTDDLVVLRKGSGPDSTFGVYERT